MSKSVLLDTSVLIHDPESVRSFPEAEVLVPIYVIMELDVLKDKEQSQVARLARRASALILEGISEGSPHPIRVVTPTGELNLSALDSANKIRYIDLLILQTAIAEAKNTDLVIISKDVNLRIIAKSIGLNAQDYTKDSPSEISVGIKHISISDPSIETEVARAYWNDSANIPLGLLENEFAHLTTPSGKSHLVQLKNGVVKPADKKLKVEGVSPRNIEQTACMSLLLDPQVELVAIVGKAGTGKTFLALACALAQAGRYQKILLSKPVVDLGKGLGFLPGDMAEKMEPWMQSFFDNLDQINPMWDVTTNNSDKESFLEKHHIEVQPIHSIRGRSLKNAYMIIDEAQNLTRHEIKSIITRAASGTKVVLLGDPHQIDHPYLDSYSNGLSYVIEKMRGQKIFGSMSLHKSERSSLSDIAADLL
jgi:PhoH-like ATPase